MQQLIYPSKLQIPPQQAHPPRNCTRNVPRSAPCFSLRLPLSPFLVLRYVKYIQISQKQVGRVGRNTSNLLKYITNLSPHFKLESGASGAKRPN
jgi:hypothetical protein